MSRFYSKMIPPHASWKLVKHRTVYVYKQGACNKRSWQATVYHTLNLFINTILSFISFSSAQIDNWLQIKENIFLPVSTKVAICLISTWSTDFYLINWFLLDKLNFKHPLTGRRFSFQYLVGDEVHSLP